MHPARRNSTILKSPSLIAAQHFEFTNAASPEVREAQQQAKNETAVSALGYEAFRMKVGNAVDEMLSNQEIKRRDEMEHQRRAAGEEHRIRPSHRLECRGKQQDVRPNSPDKSRRKLLFFVGTPMNSENLQGSNPYRFGRLAA